MNTYDMVILKRSGFLQGCERKLLNITSVVKLNLKKGIWVTIIIKGHS